MPIDFNIAGFFEKFKQGAMKEAALRQIIADSIEKNCGIKINPKEIQVKNKIIRINKVNPAAKSQLFIKKDLILKDILAQLPGFIVSDLQ